MALFRSLFRALAEPQFAAASDVREGLRATVQGTNDYIARTHGRANMFATVFFGVLDPASGALEYVKRDTSCPPCSAPTAQCERDSPPPDQPSASLPDLAFGVERECIGRGETLVAYTDGVVDATEFRGGVIGEVRLMAVLTEGAATAQALLERVDAAIGAHIADARQFDDVAMLAARGSHDRPALRPEIHHGMTGTARAA
jgi:sigma-B regulation protein RsbU (phosphoserine phosphatase)